MLDLDVEAAATNVTVPLRVALAPVGVLHIVFSHVSVVATKVKNFLHQATESSRTVTRTNPMLPVALATNLMPLPAGAQSAWSIVYHVDTNRGSSWGPRLEAVARSPFELTLEIDASATVCSPLLHTLLLHEHALNRFDFAVNFEALSLTNHSRSRFGPLPHSVEQVLPHLFAMLARKGPGLLAMLRRWHTVAQTDHDQDGLRNALIELRRTHYLSCPRSARGRVHGVRKFFGLDDDQGCSKREARAVRVRVWHLHEAIGGFKSADKLLPAGRPVGPRYVRPFAGPMLALHSFHNRTSVTGGRPICDILNAQQQYKRMVVAAPRITTPVNRTQCLHDTAAQSTSKSAAAWARGVCRMLPLRTTPSAEPETLGLAEPLEHFWKWLTEAGLTAQPL